MYTIFQNWVLPFLPSLTTVLVAFFAYKLGLKSYHLQKEYELVHKRYIDEGLDAFAADIEHALSVFKNNWQHSLVVLKYYREMDVNMRKELLDERYIELDMSQFRVIPNYRVGVLVGDKVFWDLQQLLFAFVGTATAFFKDDLGGAIRSAINGDVVVGNKKEMIEENVKKCKKYLQTANQYHVLLAEVIHVTKEFEKHRFNINTVHSFKDYYVVKESVNRLKESFKDMLSENKT